jgi:hypothetical protein
MNRILVFSFYFLLGLTIMSYATLTNGVIPVTKNGSSNPPTVQNSDITDTKGVSVTVSVPFQLQSVGGGILQLWNTPQTQYVNWTVNPGLSTNYQLNLPANAPTTNQILEIMDAMGDGNWVNVSSIAGATNWAQLGGIGVNGPNGINWTNIKNSLSAANGINWSDLITYTNTVNWGGGGNWAGTGTFGGSGQSYVRWFDSTATNWVAFQGPSTIGANVNWTLPGVDGTSGQALKTNGSKTLGWTNIEQTINYQPGLLTAVNANIGVYGKFVNASTVDNLIGSATTFSCVGNPTITMYECGTSVTCTSSPVTIGTVTITSNASAFVGTVSNPSITAGDYVGFATTAGTCASSDLSAVAQVHSN